ncbi:MAG: nucleoside-diphosphate kinase [Anaerolineaceae bacterium]|nr:nucleoside-diphosphate kinase [Anaerolineaceae bacterium]
MERTLIIIKPDAVQRGLCGDILGRLERRGLRIIGMKFMQISRDLAERHYAVHEGKPFHDGLIEYISSSPVAVIALEGRDAVAAARVTIGATNPAAAAAGTIRGDLALEVGFNLVHGSDSVENGREEVNRFFAADELQHWTRAIDRWIFE